VLITRTYIKYLNSFYTTSFSILKNKEQATYEMLFEELEKKKKKKKKKQKKKKKKKKKKKQANKYRNNTKISSKNFHCDFEKGISNTVEKIFPNINIKYCICTLKEH